MRRRFTLFTPILLLLLLPSTVLAQQAPDEEVYFAFERNGKLVGYSVDSIFLGEEGKHTEIQTKVILKLLALGQDFDIVIDLREKRDSETGKPLYIDMDYIRGEQELGGTLAFEGNEVSYVPKAAGTPKTLTLDEDVLVDDRLAHDLHSVEWDGRDDRGGGVASGIYYYRLEAGTHSESRSMVLLR